MYVLPATPQTVGGVLDSGIQLFKAAFSRCWILALAQGLASAASGIYQALEMRGGSANDALTMYQSAGFLLVTLLGTLVSMVIYIAVLNRIHVIAQGNSDTLGESVGVGVRKLPRVIVASILYVLAFFLGLVLLILPGLYVSVVLMLFLPAIVVDDKRAIEALRTSQRYVKGNFWRTSAVFTVAIVLLLVVAATIGFVVGGTIMATSGDFVLLLLVQQGVSVLITTVMTPLMAAVMLVLYFDLKLRKEGSDLETRLEASA